MSQTKALYVGGCNAPWHRIEPTVAPMTSVLEEIGLATDVTGIYHPDGGDTMEGDYSALNSANLAKYDALVLFTTGFGLGENVDAILDFVRSGKALIGIHCAGDSFADRPDFVAALGGRFRTHPAPLDITVDFVDKVHPITEGLDSFTVHDELYLFQDYDPLNVHLLASTTSFPDDQNPGSPIPIAWVREEGKGRVFYLSLGHFPEVMADPKWRKLLQRGVTWTLSAD